eukprot:CAMPEP_0117683790 /NCGR_PEP_ID=MMETSP0804-20121206/20643_1 /TAXON_ID=1074897 /ORGANISM="Tetraselmis astigmatica, Strain CCMP880" /LENGTH=70 /DNA_ID=CAMNT_0005494517 /DNA_START=371 /DNA_END=583 /DNA_ORIENTATION=+
MRLLAAWPQQQQQHQNHQHQHQDFSSSSSSSSGGGGSGIDGPPSQSRQAGRCAGLSLPAGMPPPGRQALP